MSICQGSAKYIVNEVVLHCAALTQVQIDKFKKMSAVEVRAEIDSWHRNRKPPFKKIGYHGIFMFDGSFIQGREFIEIGAHVIDHNKGTIGFLMLESKPITRIGAFADWFVEAQRVAVKAKIKSLPGIKRVSGHNDYANKLCPGFKVKSDDWL